MSFSIDQMFPSKYLSSDDLDGKTVKAKISSLDQEKMRDGTTKFILSFDGRSKGLVLNKTNGKALATAFGKDSGGWMGKEIELFSIPVDFQGRTVNGIRLRQTQPTTPVGVDATGDPNDDIPW